MPIGLTTSRDNGMIPLLTASVNGMSKLSTTSVPEWQSFTLLSRENLEAGPPMSATIEEDSR